jgi:dolichol-phosphate mannosyltransferase
LGSATLTGFAWALQQGYSHVLTMDADFSHDPRDIPALLQAAGLGTADSKLTPSRLSTGPAAQPLVIGSRYVSGGRIEGWPWTRRWASRWINRFARFWLRLPTRDNSGAFRLYPTALLRRIPLAQIRNQGYGYLEEILYLALRQGATFVEVPITFRDRTRGHSKINAREALTALGTLIRLPFR